MKYTYNWFDNEDIKKLIDNVFMNTLMATNDYGKTKQVIHALEDYLYYLLDNGFNNKFVNKIGKLKTISFNDDLVKDYAVYGNKIVLKKSLDDYHIPLYMGLSHYIIDLVNDNTRLFSKKFNEYDNTSTIRLDYLSLNGFRFMEEIFCYCFSECVFNKSTLFKEYEKPINIDIETAVYQDKFDEVFSWLVHDFARLINSQYLDPVFRKSVSQNIGEEMIVKNDGFKLFSVTYLLGLIYLERERLLGISPLPELKLDKKDVAKILASVEDIIASRLEDTQMDKIKIKKLVSERTI